jgi:iron only hydrogenase large subunit-like protein
VTSAEAVLVSLQSHTEVLTTLDTYPPLRVPWLAHNGTNGVANGHNSLGATNGVNGQHAEGKIFVASVSPQTRASLAAVLSISEVEAGNMISHLLSGPSGLKSGGQQGNGFTWVIDTNVMREACLVAAADEVTNALSPEALKVSPKPGTDGAIDTIPKAPILTSACPGWICYAEKTHPYVLPHLSRLKSPQALTGTLIKSVLSERYGIHPSQIWHLAIMPCFDKKLEASRSELTSAAWLPSHDSSQEKIRDTDCVITARELLHLAAARGLNFASLPKTPLSTSDRIQFPDPKLDAFLFPPSRQKNQTAVAGSSGGYLYHILQTYQAQNPGSSISIARGRNADVVEYSVVQGPNIIIKAARFYGFRNIQNLVRRLKPAKASRLPGGKTGVSRKPAGAAAGESVKDYAYVEVMACPGGCTNGGGQVKVQEVEDVRVYEGIQQANEDAPAPKPGPKEQKEWLARVDEAYFSGEDSERDGDGDPEMQDEEDDIVNGISRRRMKDVMAHWSEITGVDQQKLIYTSYIKVESDVGKKKPSDMERVAGLAVTAGGGW